MSHRVLVIDDSTTLRRVIAGMLARAGYEAVTVTSGEKGLEALAASPFDLVLVDFVMPKMNGFQFCRAFAASGLRPVPVGLVSVKADRIGESFMAKTGAAFALAKPFDQRTLVAHVERALAGEPAGATAPRSSEIRELAGGKSALSGDLASVSVGSVLQLLQMEGATGVLVASSGESEVRVVVRGGLVDGATARGSREEFRLGRFFLREGLVTTEEVETALRPSPEDSAAFAIRPRLGDALLAAGKISAEQLQAALTEQTSELIYEVLRWRSGTFTFRPAPADARDPRLGLPVAGMVMEGFRRVDEWRLLESQLANLDEILTLDPDAPAAASASAAELRVLHAVDESATVRDLVRKSHLSSFEAYKAIARLLDTRVLRRRAA